MLWMGGFIAVTSVMILFYYSVVTGWTLKYVLASLVGQLDGVNAEQYWTDYSSSIWQPLGFHAVSVLIGAVIISRGVVAGIERANKALIPDIAGIAHRGGSPLGDAPGRLARAPFSLQPRPVPALELPTWLEALTQSAWSTGAGWGLVLTYAIYMRRDEDLVVNATAIGLGNNTASVLAGMAVVPTAFAVLSESEALEAMAAGNTGLTFIWIPQLFARMPGGGLFLTLFFVALFCAALSSLIAMIELATRILMDGGITRRRAVQWVVAATIVGGAPSAVSVAVFENQDWVWGLALMVNGLLVALGATRFGVRRFREELVNVAGNDLNLGRGFEWVLTYLIPVEFVVMFGWWIYQAVAVIDPTGWWSPLRTYSLGTCLLQWVVALVLLVAFNKRIAAASLRGRTEPQRWQVAEEGTRMSPSPGGRGPG